MTKKLYELLEVDESVSPAMLRKAYHKKSMKLHPDKNDPKEKEKYENLYKDIVNAYEILSDQDKRKQYDKGSIDDKGHPVEQPAEHPTPTQSNSNSKTKPHNYRSAPMSGANPRSGPRKNKDTGDRHRSEHTSPQYFSTSYKNSYKSKATSEPINFSFFEQREDVFRPNHLNEDDYYFPYVIDISFDLFTLLNIIEDFVQQSAAPSTFSSEMKQTSSGNSFIYMESNTLEQMDTLIDHLFAKMILVTLDSILNQESDLGSSMSFR